MSNKYGKLKNFIESTNIIREYDSNNIELDLELRVKNFISRHLKTHEFIRHMEALNTNYDWDVKGSQELLHALDAYFELLDKRSVRLAQEAYEKALDNLKKNV